MKKLTIVFLLIVTCVSGAFSQNFGLLPFFEMEVEAGRFLGVREQVGVNMMIFDSFLSVGIDAYWATTEVDEEDVSFGETQVSASYLWPNIWDDLNLGLIGIYAASNTNEKINDFLFSNIDFTCASGVSWDPSDKLSVAAMLGWTSVDDSFMPLVKFEYHDATWAIDAFFPSNAYVYYIVNDKLQAGAFIDSRFINFDRKNDSEINLKLLQVGTGCRYKLNDFFTGTLELSGNYDIKRKDVKPSVTIGIRLL